MVDFIAANRDFENLKRKNFVQIRKLRQPHFEEVWECYDKPSKLRAIVAIHDTRRGPALGGIRMYPYPSEKQALEDALRLAKAMTFKAAAFQLKLGGGKAIIRGDPEKEKTSSLLKAMGRFIDRLKGRYIAAKDSGITVDDLVEVASETEYVVGLPESMGGSDDPSPWTALGVLEGIRACMKEKFGKASLRGRRIVIQGVGHVGFALARLLHQERAKLILSDVNRNLLQRAKKAFQAETVSPGKVYDVPADIFSPCALWGVINDRTVGRLRPKIVAGGANNPLADERAHDQLLYEKEILYAPDYVVNAGGLINIYVRDILKRKDPLPMIKKIREKLLEIFKLSRTIGIPPGQAAEFLTKKNLASNL